MPGEGESHPGTEGDPVLSGEKGGDKEGGIEIDLHDCCKSITLPIDDVRVCC